MIWDHVNKTVISKPSTHNDSMCTCQHMDTFICMQFMLIWHPSCKIGDKNMTTYTWINTTLWDLWDKVNVRLSYIIDEWRGKWKTSQQSFNIFIFTSKKVHNVFINNHWYYDPDPHIKVHWNTNQNRYWYCSVIFYILVTYNNQFVSL